MIEIYSFQVSTASKKLIISPDSEQIFGFTDTRNRTARWLTLRDDVRLILHDIYTHPLMRSSRLQLLARISRRPQARRVTGQRRHPCGRYNPTLYPWCDRLRLTYRPGYKQFETKRKHMCQMGDWRKDKDEEITLDGIGGVNIIVKADVHRSGINFPSYSFENQAETEGFAKMAKRAGYGVWGLPNYIVWHVDTKEKPGNA